MSNFTGSYVVNITPLTPDQELDEQGLRDNIEWYIDSGTAGICCCGSTGEFVSLTPEERCRVAEITVEQARGRVPVLVGTTHETTRKTIEYTHHARKIGADGALIINSYYCKPAENEIYEFYRTVSEAVDIPIMIYNNPHTTGINMSNQLIVDVCRLKNIDYIKEATGEIRRVRDLMRLSHGEIKIFCGADDLAFESFMWGAVGFISVCGNIVPGLSQELFKLVQAGDFEAAKALSLKLLPLQEMIEQSGKLVQVVKAAVNKIGNAAGPCRLPRLPLTDVEDVALEEVLRSLELV
jgi:4-hydroxy-tetrahydrodipicolinate synthase